MIGVYHFDSKCGAKLNHAKNVRTLDLTEMTSKRDIVNAIGANLYGETGYQMSEAGTGNLDSLSDVLSYWFYENRLKKTRVIIGLAKAKLRDKGIVEILVNIFHEAQFSSLLYFDDFTCDEIKQYAKNVIVDFHIING